VKPHGSDTIKPVIGAKPRDREDRKSQDESLTRPSKCSSSVLSGRKSGGKTKGEARIKGGETVNGRLQKRRKRNTSEVGSKTNIVDQPTNFIGKMEERMEGSKRRSYYPNGCPTRERIVGKTWKN